MNPVSPRCKPGAPVGIVNVPAPVAPAAPVVAPETSSFVNTVSSALQDGGARASGFVTGEKGPVPADAVLPPRMVPLGAVATGIAVAGVVALAGASGVTAAGGVLGTFLERILTVLRHLASPVTDFFGDRFTSHVEDHTADVLEQHTTSLSRSLDASRNPLIPHNSQILVLGIGAALYGLAFVVAERTGLVPQVLVTYLIVSGLVVVLHEMVHHLAARRFGTGI